MYHAGSTALGDAGGRGAACPQPNIIQRLLRIVSNRNPWNGLKSRLSGGLGHGAGTGLPASTEATISAPTLLSFPVNCLLVTVNQGRLAELSSLETRAIFARFYLSSFLFVCLARWPRFMSFFSNARCGA